MRSLLLLLLLVALVLLGGTTKPNKDNFTKTKKVIEISEVIEIEPLEKLADKIAMVETLDKDIIGDGGDAIGHFQIHQAMLTDFNRYYGKEYTHEEMHDRDKGKEVCIGMLKLGIKLYKDKYNQNPDTENLARMWNGGIYGGYRYTSTEIYWSGFQERVDIDNTTWSGDIQIYELCKIYYD